MPVSGSEIEPDGRSGRPRHMRKILIAVAALAISFIVGPAMIRKLTTYKIGQAVREGTS